MSRILKWSSKQTAESSIVFISCSCFLKIQSIPCVPIPFMFCTKTTRWKSLSKSRREELFFMGERVHLLQVCDVRKGWITTSDNVVSSFWKRPHKTSWRQWFVGRSLKAGTITKTLKRSLLNVDLSIVERSKYRLDIQKKLCKIFGWDYETWNKKKFSRSC